MRNWVRFPLVLGLICILAACGVGSVYVLTRDRIEEQQQKRQAEALSIIFGSGVRQKALNDPKEPLDRVFEVTDAGGKRIGFMAAGIGQGYSSKLRVMVGVDCDHDDVRSVGDLKCIRAIQILFQNETPGLGSRVEEIESDRTWLTVLSGEDTGDESGKRPKFQEAFAGLAIVEGEPAVDTVDGITGATISSNATRAAVRDAVGKIVAVVAPGGTREAADARTGE